MPSPTSPRPAAKRIKLEDLTPTAFDIETNAQNKIDAESQEDLADDVEEDEENSCSICLHSIVDRTVIPKCSHEFCFECLLVWTEQSRRCPLCSQAIGEYLIHSIRSRYDYRKHYLSPLRTSPPPSRPVQTNAIRTISRQDASRRRRPVQWGTRESRVREHEEFDKLERSIMKRRWIYQHDLYAKHVASNSYTKYRPYPTPSQFSASQELISRTTTFLRRELQVWEGLDIEFLTNLIVSLMKAIDIRSESAVKLISEFLDMDVPYTPGGRHVNAEHFAHEVYCYVRSPYRDLFVYDQVAQYDLPPQIPPPPDFERSHRWLPPPSPPPAAGPSRENNSRRLPSTSRSSERSDTPSPSGKQYCSLKNRATSVEPGTAHIETSGDTPRSPPNGVLRDDRGRQHRANISAGNIVDNVIERTYSDAPFESSFPHSLPSNSTPTTNSNYTPARAEKSDLKGKGRAYSRPESTKPFESESPGSMPNVADSESTLIPPAKMFETNEVDHSLTKTPVFSNRSRTLRPARNITLLDSVREHLGRNPHSNIKSNMPRARRYSGNTKDHTNTSVSAEVPPVSRDQTDNVPTSTSTAIAQAPSPSLPTGCREETRFMDISRVERRVSNQLPSNTRERSPHGNLSDPSIPPIALEGKKLCATGVTPGIEPSAQRDGTVSAGNNTVLSNAIIDAAPSPPSSSNVRIIYDHDICAAEAKPSRIDDVGSEVLTHLSTQKLSSQSVNPSTRAVKDSASVLFRNHENKNEIHDVQDSSYSDTAHSPIRKDASTDAASITIVNQIPHATDTRTRLLVARLEIEKRRTCAPGLQDDAEARVLRESSVPTSSSSNIASEDVTAPSLNTSSGRHLQHPGISANSPNRDNCARADPDSRSAEENVKAREVKLRARVQLRARLAAEKRIVGGSSNR